MKIYSVTEPSSGLRGRAFNKSNEIKQIDFIRGSYLFLESDIRVRIAASFQENDLLSIPSNNNISLHRDMDQLMHQLFNYPVLLVPTTIIGHLAILSALANSKDLIIINSSSPQTIASIANLNNIPFFVLEENKTNTIEKSLDQWTKEYRKIWYISKSISNKGELIAPLESLNLLMNKYEQFHCFLEDTNGLSWIGENGKGYVLNQIPMHPQMVLLFSLSKGFGTEGNVLVFSNDKIKQQVYQQQNPLSYGTRLTPITMKTSIAAAKIHLSSEFKKIQDELQKRIDFFIKKANALGLNLLPKSIAENPICVIDVETENQGERIRKTLLKNGFLVKAINYYSDDHVSRSTIQFNLSIRHSNEQIYKALKLLKTTLKQRQ